MLRKLFSREKHRCMVIYPDQVYYYEFPADTEEFEDDRGKKYYIDAKRLNHVYIGGYANEIDYVKATKDAKKYEFEPSDTLEILAEKRIRRALINPDNGMDWYYYALILGLIIAIGIGVAQYLSLSKLIAALTKVGLIK